MDFPFFPPNRTFDFYTVADYYPDLNSESALLQPVAKIKSWTKMPTPKARVLVPEPFSAIIRRIREYPDFPFNV